MASKALADLKARKEAFKQSISAAFQAHFGVSLEGFWNTTVGCIDMVVLDNTLLRSPDGTSPMHQMEKDFGPAAVEWYERNQAAAFAIKVNWELDH